MTDEYSPGGSQLGSLPGKRILLLFPHMTSAGGALHYALKLASLLAERGAQVAILTLRVDPASFTAPAGVEILTLQGPLTSSLAYWVFLPFWQARIDQKIAAWRPDLLVPQVFPANWWGWLYKRKHPDLPLIWVCQEPSAFIHSKAWIAALTPRWKGRLAGFLSPLLAKVDKHLARLSDRIIANSTFTGSEVERVYGVKPDAISYPGIDVKESLPDPPAKERALISVARLTSFKRIDFLIEVFCQMLPRHPDLTFRIVGTGEDELSLRRLAQARGFASRITFCGAVDDATLTDLYRRSTLYLHGSVGEPFGMAPLEAIAHGTPALAHKSGGPLEYIEPKCGILVDSLAAADWARAASDFLDTIFAHPLRPERVAACASRFDWRKSLLPAQEVIAGLCSTGGVSSTHEADAAGPNHPLISIVMPSYQQAGFLEEAVRSVLDQREVEAELIVLDPGSTDGSREILLRLKSAYGERLVLRFAPDDGQGDAVNLGMALARGRVLGWLNSDDRLRPGALALAVAQLDKAEPCWLYGRGGIIDEQGSATSRPIVLYKNWRGKRFSIYKLITEDFIPQMACFWNRALWEQSGGIDARLHLDLDYDLFLRFAEISAPLVSTAYLGDFRVHRDAKSSQRTAEHLAAARKTARHFSHRYGLRGKLAYVLHTVYSLRTRLVYLILKP